MSPMKHESAAGNILGFFLSKYFIINNLRICLRDQIFRALLERFISEFARK